MAATAIVCGAGGFIGAHLVKRLKRDGFWVRGVERHHPLYAATAADAFWLGDLRDPRFAQAVVEGGATELYQLAADMGGAGYVFTGEHDADILQNSARINLNVLAACRDQPIARVFYASSACVYPADNQTDPAQPRCDEDSAVPARPDSAYGWEKLFAEQLYLAYRHNAGLDLRVGRYHNVFGPEGAWTGGREKAHAALCRKVAAADDGEAIAVWGDGRQTRSFLYIDDAFEATIRLMRAPDPGPLNIGSEELVSINELVQTIERVAGKSVGIRNIPGPTGVRGRCSDNRRIRAALGWAPQTSLHAGLADTYPWVAAQVAAQQTRGDPVPG